MSPTKGPNPATGARLVIDHKRDMQVIEPPVQLPQGYEVVADFHVAGRSFLRGEQKEERELAGLKTALLAAGLIRRVEASSSI